MDFKQYKRLKRLALSQTNLQEFFNEVAKWSSRYGVPCWNKVHYEDFYNRIKGGARYEHFNTAKAA